LSLSLPGQGKVTITADVENCGAKLQLYTFTGFGFEPLIPLMPDAEGDYRATLSVKEPLFRYLGASPGDALPILLQGGDTVRVTGSCGNLKAATVTGSDINTEYAALRASFDDFNERYTTLVQDIEVIQNERVNREGREAMLQLDREKKQLAQRLKRETPLLGRIASLNTYLSHYSDTSGVYSNQLEHYIDTYFQFVDFDDPGYDDLSWTYEGGRGFANNLMRAIPGAQLADILLSQTGRWPAGSRARFLARSGALSSLLPDKHPASAPLADSIIAEYAELYPGQVAMIRNQTASLRSFTIGAPAPLFTAPTPEGESLSLESLRGEVVLLDFWASWCGPCRRENPNVVRMYHKFRDKGFEILGVSLDDKRDRWEQAIATDKLDWLHVSDLKGWQSEYGQLYGVTSIPQTVLLDREGNILARNLRGPDLERKLEEVLGVN
jgi:peroxiredoxin